MSNKRKARLPRPVPASQRKPSVVVAFVHPGQWSAYFGTSLATMLIYDLNGPKHLAGMVQDWSSANVSASRNELTGKFLDDHPDAEWLLWIDADMSFDADVIDQFLAVADPEHAPVVGGLAFGMQGGKLFPTLYNLAEDPDTGHPVTVRAAAYPKDTMVRVAATGAACLFVHRSVLERIREHGFNATFPFFQEVEMGGRPCGEDITFCLRCLALDIPVHVHTGIKFGHHKSAVLDEALFDAQEVSGD